MPPIVSQFDHANVCRVFLGRLEGGGGGGKARASAAAAPGPLWTGGSAMSEVERDDYFLAHGVEPPLASPKAPKPIPPARGEDAVTISR